MAWKTILHRRLPPRRIRSLPWTRCLVKTMERKTFSGKGYPAENILHQITRIYKLPLKPLRGTGLLTVDLPGRTSSSKQLQDQTFSKDYLKIVDSLNEFSESVRETIVKITGKTSRCRYA